jgi:proteasome alpha subunit
VEVIVAEVGDPTLAGHEQNAIYRVQFDGSISDHEGYCVIGGAADELGNLLRADYRPGLSLGDALQLGRRALQRAAEGQPQVATENLEVCVLDRNRAGRKFHRLSTDTLREHLGA